MHGMINRALQRFLLDTYGPDRWQRIARSAGLGPDAIDALMAHGSERTDRVVDAAVRHLGKPRSILLEDLGTYLVSHPNMRVIRRLLRFGGPTFVDFLYSLEDLPERARLAVPDLPLPVLDVTDHDGTCFTLAVRHEREGFGSVMAGVLRAMADEYGALVLLEHSARHGDTDILTMELAAPEFAAGRVFHLGRGVS